ncbi:MAG TPA: bifunctional ornithine acetyltransferase/N-acetylglutamate synthase [Candidatus Limnocylindrales bacterium]|nr:bifunctional ornithine acetyltransferase/N-acetylglutamate synthase [Candidatus Limnocylindrales bacterium]
MTAIVNVPIPTSSPDLPLVERHAALPAGFRAGGLAAGIKASGRPDLAVIVTTGGPAAAAAVFTPNALAAAPVRVSRRHLAATSGDPRGGFGWAEAIISTSGSANAATGPAGDADQLEIAGLVARATGSAVERTLHLSTGIIGTRLPLDRVAAGLDALVPTLTGDDAGLGAAAVALCTTDSVVKTATTSISLPTGDGRSIEVTVSGIAKGVGMIHPQMATMLSVILTDAAAAPETLWQILRPAAARTWNQLSVDGDTSTNDTVFVLASGAAGVEPVEDGTPAAARLGAAIEAVARDLARQQAADGEGASTLITTLVTGARDDAEARAVARAVVSSSLVKAAAHGRDPNWGRIAGAAGNARLPTGAVLEAAGLPPNEAASRAGTAALLDPAKLRIWVAGFLVFDGAQAGPVAFDRAAARAAMEAPEVVFALDLGLGVGSGEAFGCDLTEAYVIENSEYTT